MYMWLLFVLYMYLEHVIVYVLRVYILHNHTILYIHCLQYTSSQNSKLRKALRERIYTCTVVDPLYSPSLPPVELIYYPCVNTLQSRAHPKDSHPKAETTQCRFNINPRKNGRPYGRKYWFQRTSNDCPCF